VNWIERKSFTDGGALGFGVTRITVTPASWSATVRIENRTRGDATRGTTRSVAVCRADETLRDAGADGRPVGLATIPRQHGRPTSRP
jgi:hypothetical protein